MIYADFESIIVPEDNGKQNLSLLRTNMNKNWVAVMVINYCVLINLVGLWSHGVYNFINSVVKESKHFSNVIKEHFHKEFVMAAKKDDKDFDNST